MGFLKRLLGENSAPSWPPPGPITSWPGDFRLASDLESLVLAQASHTVDVVGEASYRPALDLLAGGRTPDGATNADHTALLLPEPSNEHDPNAVRVFLITGSDGDASLVGYLSREDAVAYRPVIDHLAADGRLAVCRASIAGGWDRGQEDRGSFRVQLSLNTPAEILHELGVDVADDVSAVRERLYANSACPYCASDLPEYPRSRKPCPSCAQPIHVRLGPDGLTYLLQADDLPAMDQLWTEHRISKRSTRWSTPRSTSPARKIAVIDTNALALRPDHPYVGWVVAFTGDSSCSVAGMPLDRPASELIARKAGMAIHPRVTRNVQLLVDCDDRGTSGNQRRAAKYGIPVIAERPFWTSIGLSVDHG